MAKDPNFEVKPLYTAVTDIRQGNDHTLNLRTSEASNLPQSSHRLDLRSEDVSDDFFEFIPAYVPIDDKYIPHPPQVQPYNFKQTIEERFEDLMRQASKLVALLELPVNKLSERTGLSRRSVVVMLSVLVGMIAGLVMVLFVAQSTPSRVSGPTTPTDQSVGVTQLPTAGGSAFRILFPKAPSKLLDSLSDERRAVLAGFSSYAPNVANGAMQPGIQYPLNSSATSSASSPANNPVSTYGAYTPATSSVQPVNQPSTQSIPSATIPSQKQVVAPLPQTAPATVPQYVPQSVPQSAPTLPSGL